MLLWTAMDSNGQQWTAWTAMDGNGWQWTAMDGNGNKKKTKKSP